MCESPPIGPIPILPILVMKPGRRGVQECLEKIGMELSYCQVRLVRSTHFCIHYVFTI